MVRIALEELVDEDVEREPFPIFEKKIIAF